MNVSGAVIINFTLPLAPVQVGNINLALSADDGATQPKEKSCLYTFSKKNSNEHSKPTYYCTFFQSIS
ncbi:hypothetical protein NQ317_007079 [Molorchus minor]|uniref:Uncharacterized protein n=1 Tax=Molorchus minor TaxID=1323400 RepID=A0ABQ9K5K3_9CUCU|nr:hypothetical protein NQ317_007079 [Molorchus minor]